MSQAEATYRLQPNQPNQPTDVQNIAPDDNRYISVRITVGHDQVYKIVDKVLYDVEQYIIAPHKANTANEHFHVAIPIGNEKSSTACERYRKRAKSVNGGGAGKIATKLYENGIEQFVAYVKHEDCQPVLKGYTEAWFAEIERKQKDQSGISSHMDKRPVKPRNPDHFKQITYQNLEKVSLRYRRDNCIKSKQLEDTLEAMHRDGWRLQISVLRGGIPDSFFEQFTKACDEDTIFTHGRFNRMRIIEKWRDEFNRA